MRQSHSKAIKANTPIAMLIRNSGGTMVALQGNTGKTWHAGLGRAQYAKRVQTIITETIAIF
jgi:hypothetical protein